ncbi:MAG: hypothetical protein HRU20_10005 [Pseudomonadales bacterium]|nr:hypothetical protein [Pseudomonadales bacterium]
MKSIIFLIIVSFSTGAHAYIDPGTASLLLQGLIASMAAAMATCGIYFQKIKMFFGGNKHNVEDQEKEQ